MASNCSTTSKGKKRKTEDSGCFSPDDDFKFPGPFPLPSGKKDAELSGPSSTISKTDPSKKNEDRNPMRKRKSEKAVKLPKHTQSSEMSGAEILFFFDLDYSRYPSRPIDLTSSSSVEHILGSMFKFVSPCDYEDDNDDDNSTFIFRGVSMLDMLKKYFLVRPALEWMKENDQLNYKKCSSRAIKEKLKSIKQIRQNEKFWPSGKTIVLKFVETLMVEYSINGLNNHDCALSIFRLLQPLMKINANMKYNGEAKYELLYRVSEDIASDKSPSNTSKVFEGERLCVIGVCPDTVYEEGGIPLIAVEVFAPRDGNPATASEDEVILSQSSSDKVYSKPERKKDAVVNKEYRKKANQFLKQFVFHDCSDSATMNKILGQHIVQLITLADIQKQKEKDNQKQKEKEMQQVIGIFMKNEYLFFSKLLINNAKIRSYNPITRELVAFLHDRLSEIGKVTFANWRIDLTLPAHRMALVAFLGNCVGNFLQ